MTLTPLTGLLRGFFLGGERWGALWTTISSSMSAGWIGDQVCWQVDWPETEEGTQIHSTDAYPYSTRATLRRSLLLVR